MFGAELQLGDARPLPCGASVGVLSWRGARLALTPPPGSSLADVTGLVCVIGKGFWEWGVRGGRGEGAATLPPGRAGTPNPVHAAAHPAQGPFGEWW